MRSLIFFAVATLALTAVAAEEKKIVCYFASWSVYRPGAGQFNVDDIDPMLCTHLIYSFVGLTGSEVSILDSGVAMSEKNGYARFNALRKQNPNLKTLVAVGGWGEGCTKYSAMASNPSSRATFVKSVIDFVKKHNFDGFDVDWEYPAQRGGSPADVDNYVALLKELREALDKEGLILSAAVGVSEFTASQSYNIAEMSKYLHFINIMAYDFHGSYDGKTGMNAPLRAASSETGGDAKLNIEAAVKFWMSKGAPASKIVLGTPAYGRSFTLGDPNSATVGAPASVGMAGPYSGESGMVGYNEICELQNTQQWTDKFDEERRVPYTYRGNQWISYDNVKSIKEKAEFINKMGLGGAMVWAIDMDDFKGKCGQKFPLISTLNAVLRNGKPVSESPAQPTRQEASAVTPRAPVTSYNNNNKPSSNTATGNGECTSAGNIADPQTCEQYFTCVAATTGFVKYVMHCPPGLCYKAASGRCDWK